MQANEELLSGYRPAAQSFLWTILFCCIIHGFSYYILFRKAGFSGWKALIPFYSIYLRFRLAWKSVWFWIGIGALALLIIPINLDSTAAILLSGIDLFFCIGLEFSLQIHLGRAFHWGIFPCILLGLFNPIMLPILAFFSKSYRGTHCNRIF